MNTKVKVGKINEEAKEAVNINISKQNDIFFQVKDRKGNTGWVSKRYLSCL